MEGDNAVRKNVKLGAEAARGVEVLEGLSGTETVIVAPLDKLTDGARVTAAS